MEINALARPSAATLEPATLEPATLEPAVVESCAPDPPPSPPS
ncbi:hypothetical protein ACWIG5_05150 [Streptomyces lydicus]